MKKYGWIFILALWASAAESKILVHGHRGSRGTHPENTLPAFEEAVLAGADVLELDLQLTKDNVPVIGHDFLISEPLCQPQKIKMSLPQPIRLLTLEQVLSFDCGSTVLEKFPGQTRVPGTAMPSLEQFFVWASTRAPRLQFNIETKMEAEATFVPDPELFVSRVLELIRKFGVADRTILQSFDFRMLAVARKKEPGLRLACLFKDERNFCELTKRFGSTIASPNFELVTRLEMRKCKSDGIQVFPWTVNRPGDWRRLIQLGVDGLITDYPRNLINFLKALGNG